MSNTHHYSLLLKWTGNTGSGTSDYKSYLRSHQIIIENKTVIEATSDKAFRGDASKHNPEELLLASVSSCHMLWYLHICADAGVVVVEYTDKPTGELEITSNGSGRFTEIILRPDIYVTKDFMIEKAISLHEKAHQMCFIANSVNFPIKILGNVFVKR